MISKNDEINIYYDEKYYNWLGSKLAIEKIHRYNKFLNFINIKLLKNVNSSDIFILNSIKKISSYSIQISSSNKIIYIEHKKYDNYSDINFKLE